MSKISQKLARWVYGWLLWFLRRPLVRSTLQRRHGVEPFAVVKSKRHETFIRQNAFARRHGLRFLTLTFNLLFAYLVCGLVYWSAFNLYDSGYFSVPKSIQDRAQSPRS
jgi:hypothetical protein